MASLLIRVMKQHQASAAQLFIPDWHPHLAQGHRSRNSRTKEEEQKVGKLTPRDKQSGSEGEVKNMSNRELCTSNWAIRLNWTNPVTNRLLIGWPPHATEKPHPSVLFHLSPLSCSHPGSSACRRLIWAELMLSAANRKGFNHTGWPLTCGRTPPATPPHTDHLHSLIAHHLSLLKVRSSCHPELSRSCLLPGDGCPSFFHRTVCPLSAWGHVPIGYCPPDNPVKPELRTRNLHPSHAQTFIVAASSFMYIPVTGGKFIISWQVLLDMFGLRFNN